MLGAGVAQVKNRRQHLSRHDGWVVDWEYEDRKTKICENVFLSVLLIASLGWGTCMFVLLGF